MKRSFAASILFMLLVCLLAVSFPATKKQTRSSSTPLPLFPSTWMYTSFHHTYGSVIPYPQNGTSGRIWKLHFPWGSE